MKRKRFSELLSAHADELIGRGPGGSSAEESEAPGPLFQLAEELQEVLAPVRPPASFKEELGRRLERLAQSPPILIETPRAIWRRRWILGAMVAGLVSLVLSAVGVVAYFLRARGGGDSHPT